jgi:predicted aspartyl protease
MPVLNVQPLGQARQPDGTTVTVAPTFTLQRSGPVVQVTIGVADVISAQLLQQGQQPPAPLSGLGLIDTGASSTCIDESVAQSLGLPVIDVVQISTPSQAQVQQNVYPAVLEIVGGNIRVSVPRAIGAVLRGQGIVALIGRDFLQNCTLHFNGPAGMFTLAYWP